MRIRESATKHEKIVVVCAWCMDCKELTEEYKDNGYEVSHGICAKCTESMAPTDSESNADKQVVDGFGEKPFHQHVEVTDERL